MIAVSGTPYVGRANPVDLEKLKDYYDKKWAEHQAQIPQPEVVRPEVKDLTDQIAESEKIYKRN